MSASAAPTFKAAMLAACQALYADVETVSGNDYVQVFYGWPTAYSDEMVILGDVTSEQDLATMGNPRRREETVTLTVTIMGTLGGSDQQAITERAYYLLGLLEAYLQDSGVAGSSQVTLGGVVREARVVGHELTETADEDDAAVARTADITATVVAHVRI